MNIINKQFIPGFLFALLVFSSCKKADFAEINTNPETLYEIPAENQFLNATISIHNTDFEWYYDNYRRIMPWMQMNTATAGNSKTFIEEVGNFNQRYGNFYSNVGNRLADIPKLIEKLPADQQATMVHMKAISDVLMAYYTFYVSDINGSIPFKEAFRGRYEGVFTPKSDTQEEIFNALDEMLKTSVTTLKATQPVNQRSLANYDLYYKGLVPNWIKAANALRLKIAMRLMKVNPAKLKTVATEVLGSAADLMSSDADSWVFDAIASFAGGGNWNPEGLRAPKAPLEFMQANADPRLRFFYHKTRYGQYLGSFASPDASSNPINARLYANPDTLSNIQYRLFGASYDNGTGINYFPVITYADFCFMRAELAARAITTENPETWYNAGVTASIKNYDKWARDAKIIERNAANAWVESYVAVTDAEITNYLAQPNVKYDAAKGIEKICVQAYLNYYKIPNEAWALYKRTGFPNSTSVLPLEVITADGVVQTVPRRAAVKVAPPTDLNFSNNKAALDEMLKNPDFGSGPSDVFGRVWWDKK